MSAPNPIWQRALRWLRDHGGNAAVARTVSRGRVIMAQGDFAPFTPLTFKQLLEAGLIEYYDYAGVAKSRLRMTDAGKTYAQP